MLPFLWSLPRKLRHGVFITDVSNNRSSLGTNRNISIIWIISTNIAALFGNICIFTFSKKDKNKKRGYNIQDVYSCTL
jgi:hypothetical protein